MKEPTCAELADAFEKKQRRLRFALAEVGDGFRQFARNGRWGTCNDCPRDARGDAYPEFCVNTERIDHHINAKSLAESFEWRMTPGRYLP